jgi:CheY-like chemotaxis protein
MAWKPCAPPSANRFDLILMDCSMPEMDGYEATAHIRLAELASGPRTPLMAMTANTQIGDAKNAWPPAWTTIWPNPSRWSNCAASWKMAAAAGCAGHTPARTAD